MIKYKNNFKVLNSGDSLSEESVVGSVRVEPFIDALVAAGSCSVVSIFRQWVFGDRYVNRLTARECL